MLSGSKRVLWLCFAIFCLVELPGVASFHQLTTPRQASLQSISMLRTPSTRRRSRAQAFSPSPLKSAEVSSDEEQEAVPKTMRDAVHRFFLGPDRGPISIVGLLAGFLGWRLGMEAAVRPTDGLVFAVSIVFWWFQEHIMHQRLLHSDFDWMGKEIHQGHHKKPYFHISIDPAGLMLGWLAVVHVILRLVLPVDLAVSATVGYAGAGLVYEWAHYVAHTRVKPANAFWKRVRDNHIKHHMVDDCYWFGFSLPAIDDWMGTNPSVQEVKQARAKNKVPTKELQRV
jgi:hypothetical protein